MIEKLIDLYTRFGKGVYDESNRLKTKAIIMHLIDNGFTEKEIASIINSCKIKDYMTPQDLPDNLWEDSLLKRDTFYYSSALQLVSAPPRWNPEKMTYSSEPFYLEMKIKFTIEDLVNHYYKELDIDTNFRDYSKDKGALQYLLNKYKIDNVESIDVILMLIEEAKSTMCEYSIITNPLKLQDYEGTVISFLKTAIPNKIISKSNQIVWRTCNE